MADKAKTLFQRLHLKPSTTLKVSKTAIFVLLGLISVQTVAGGLLWYAKQIKAAGGISQVSTVATLTNFGISTTVDGSGNRYVMQFDGYIRKYNSSGSFQQQWGGRGSAFTEEEYVPGQFYSGEVGYYIAAGPSNTLYATNVDHIEKFTTTGGHTLSWALPDNLWASGVTADSAGYVYVVTGLQGWAGAVTGVPEILKYSPTGVLQTRWGSAGTGNGQFSAANGLALATDSSNNVYVVDGGNYRVQKFNSSGDYQTQWGTQGTDPGQLAGPLAITVNSANQVYVLDMEGGGVAIEKFSDTGTHLAWADLGANPPVISIAAESGNYLVGTNINSNNSVSQLVRLQDTTSLSIDTTSLPAATSWQNYGGYAISTSGRQGNVTLSVVSGALPPGMEFRAYTEVDANNGLVAGTPTVAGTYTFTVQAQDAVSTVTQQLTLTVAQGSPPRSVTTAESTGVSQTSATLEGFTDMPSSITQRGFEYGTGTSYGSSVADGDAIEYARSGVMNPSVVGGYSTGIDSADNIYKPTFDNDSHYAAINKYSTSGTLLEEFGSYGTGNGQFVSPVDVAVDASGNMYVIDITRSYLQVLDSSGDYLRSFPINKQSGGAAAPISVALDSSGNIYVVGMGGYQPTVQKYNSAGILQAEFINSIGSGANQLGSGDQTNHIAIDGDDRLYITDYTNSRVLKYDVSGSSPAFVAQWGLDGRPISVKATSGGLIYLGVEGNVYGYNTNGTKLYQWLGAADVPSVVVGMVVDSRGVIYINDTSGYYGEANKKGSIGIGASLSGLSCNTTYHYRAFATDASGTSYGNDATFTTEACPDVPINVTTTTLQGGTTTVEYQDLVNVENVTGGVAYTVSSGALPDGLSLNPSTGYITGTPTVAGTFNFEVTAEDSNSTDTQALSIVVSAYQAPLQITTVALPDVVHSQPCCLPYSENVYSQGSVGDVTYSVVAGTMPPGLSLQVLGNTSVSVAGNPTTPGTYTFTIQAQDSRGNGPGGTDTQEYTIVVPDFPSLNIDTTNLPNGMVGIPYNRTVQYSNYVTQPVFSIVSGSLPDGISLTLNGYLQGTPTVAGTYTFTIQAQDIRPGGGDTDTQQLTLVVEPAPAPVVNTPFVTITSPANNTTFTGGAKTITGTGPANQTISIFVDNQQIGTTTASSEGLWTYNAQNIAPGNHTLDAKWVPGAEVMFVPYLDMQNLRTNVRVYDTSTDQLVKELALPFYSFAYQATVSPNSGKLFLTGAFEATGEGGVWEVDLNTSAITAYRSAGGPIASAVLSPDGTKLYTNSVTNVVKSFNVGQGFSESGLVLSGGGHDAPAMLKLSEDGSELYAMVFDSNDTQGGHTPAPFTIKVISPSDLTVQRSIDVTSVADPGNPEWTSGFGVAGNVAYVPFGTVDAIDRVGISALRLYDLANGSILKTIDISQLTAEEGYVVAGNVYVDVPSNTAYMSGKSVNLPGYSYFLRINLGTNDVQSTQLTSGQGGGALLFLRGFAAASSVGKLYLSPWLNGQPAEGIEVYDMVAQSVLGGPGYPLLNPANNFAYNLGSNFIASITPPKDSIAFSVPNGGTPTCEQLGNCPQTCEQLGNCPKPPTCEETNTCPKVDCTTTNTCPTTVVPPTPPTTSVTPKIISTQFPTPGATPSTSRLGWLDRTALAVARFVPQQAAIGFPYVLFVLLLCFALSLYYQSSNEIRKDKLNRDFLAKRTSIRAQQDNFIALASHYLNTPITIIQGGVELEEGKSKK